MSWMQRLYDTYEQATKLDLPLEKSIPPIRHTIQNAHINIVINDKAEFISAKVLKKFPIVLPATEASEARGGKVDAPHGLADKLQYVAKDYSSWGGGKKPFFESYYKQLNAWCKVGAPRKVEIVRDYVGRGKVLTDLIQKAAIFEESSAHTVLTTWPEVRGDPPEIFDSLPKEGGVIETGSALVCWSVEIFNNPERDTWKDSEVWESWIRFQAHQETSVSLCIVTGVESPNARLHPAKLRHRGDKAKIISANDQAGMTFRGRFIDSTEATSVGSDVTQKAHNALRWLVTRQGVRNGDQVTVAWAISGKPILNPVADWCFDDESAALQADDLVDINAVDHSNDLGYRIATKIKLKLKGYQQELNATEQLSLMVLDSTTAKSGRMSICYYREFLPNEYFKYLNAWYDEYAWYQRITKVQEQPGKSKKVKTTVWVEVPPSPLAIAQAVYGKTLSDELKKQVFSTVLTCIAEGRQIPEVLVQAAVQMACNPMRKELNQTDSEVQETWERNLGVTCALYKGFYARHPDVQQKRSYSMSLDRECKSRDYLYGRLLAVAERIEFIALHVAKEKRRTTAERYMQRFAEHPFGTWPDIVAALDPYKARLQNSRIGFLVNREKEITDIHCMFDPVDFCKSAKLSGEFLLGYHCQKMTYRKSKAKDEDESEDKSESPSSDA